MLFVTISKEDNRYARGKYLSRERYKMSGGAALFFYDKDSILREFGRYGLTGIEKIEEPIRFHENRPPMKFIMIECRKVS